MDDKENNNSTNEGNAAPKESPEESEDKEQSVYDAGPSGTMPLPGSIQNQKNILQSKTGISKSEHSIRHIITTKDVTNALKSLSFATPTQGIRNINFKDLDAPILEDRESEKEDSATLVDLKRFMASCFKMSKEPVNTLAMNELPRQTMQTVVSSVVIEVPEPPDVTCVNNALQTESAPIKANEVIVTKTIDPKIKTVPDKKKPLGNVSERSDLGIAQRDSLSSIGSNVCRICMTRGRERLISPCNCKGSLANVHLSCLERWLNQVGRNHCELCGYSYPAIRTPRYTVLQALRLWFGNPRNRSHLQSDCLIFWLLSTVTAGLLAVCIVGTQYFVIEGSNFGKIDAGVRKDEGISHRITETAMDFFMAIVLCGYSVTVYLLWKDHYVMWNRWRRANVNVRLLLSPDANPVPFVPRTRYNVV